MAEELMDKVIRKAVKSVLKYVVSIVDNKVADGIENYFRQQVISELDETLHAELESMLTDSVKAEKLEDFLAKDGIFPGCKMKYDWVLMETTTNRLVDEFFSLRPEWTHNRDSIAPVIRQIVTATYDVVLACLDWDGRILYIQAQKNSESLRGAIRSLEIKVAEAVSQWNNNKCVFKTDVYDAYLEKYQDKLYRWPFWVNHNGEEYHLEDVAIPYEELINELEIFLDYSWRKQMREKLKVCERDYPSIANSIYNISSSFSMEQTRKRIEKRILAQIESDPKDQKWLDSIRKKLNNTPFGNCLCISGCFGCGKTSMSFELAKHAQKNPGKFGDTVFVFVSSEQSEKIQDNICAEFGKLFSRECSLDQYLDAFSDERRLVIVLDDLQRYFQKGVLLDEVFAVIKEYSRSYVKWIITTQPGYNKGSYGQYKRFYDEYAHPWKSIEAGDLIDKWFPLDAWHRSKDTPGQMINHILKIDSWEWKDKVSTTNYYTPLFANILISYHLNHECENVFSRRNLLFPDFCDLFYSILAGNPDNLEQDVIKLVQVFLELHKLKFPIKDDTPQDIYSRLINRGLLLKIIPGKAKRTSFEGTPDIVWIYQMAISLQTDWLDDEGHIKPEMKDIEWPDGKELLRDIMSMVVQIAHSEAEDYGVDVLKQNWEQLLKWGDCQPVIDSGINCEPNLRNMLIKILLKNMKIWKNHFDEIMYLCAFGKVENKLLLRVIKRSVFDVKSQMVKHGPLFAHMLSINIPSLSWGEIVSVFELLRNVRFDARVSRDIGTLLGGNLVKRAAETQKLQEAIEQTREISKKDGKKEYDSYPSDLYDWFCASICDTMIDEFKSEGYEDLRRAQWLVVNPSPEWKEMHRNKALTFALAEHYRFSLRRGNDSYKNWFEGLMEELKSGTKHDKTFALYSIVHIGLKDEGYAIDPDSKLLGFATEILGYDSMRNLRYDPSVELFMKTNLIG